ncbi:MULTISPECIES: DEAD/DEAH box helicase [Bacillaceae]|uniref:DEAD/DEAH box helicase n=1 Tax=Bacillaceae TaxID=186817 RepID=UPI002964A33D|nr:DEAD/DEAH box helicase [Bacillus infantis]MDW2876639.1 DEAD/DEAH box helicase [Bacillus infantis]
MINLKFKIQAGRLIQDQNGTPISKLAQIPVVPVNPAFKPDEKLAEMLAGKQLLTDELPFTLQEIDQHYQNGHIIYRQGIVFTGKKPQCARCGNTQPHLFAKFPCARCKEDCLYCRSCIMMGRISSCTPLISWQGPEPPHPQPKIYLKWSGNLSVGQQAASDRTLQAIHQNNELLVWAVCGAGKTEVLFAGIDQALQAGKRVCLATPRTDVVLELTPRLKKVFPEITVASLYGGSVDRHLYAPLTIATTHQLFRFRQAFDTVILDEVDAFPYSVDTNLQYAVKQARKPESSMIYLTATPNQKWQKDCFSGKKDYITIPARYHRHPLPVPEYRWCGNWEKHLKKGRLPSPVISWISRRIQISKQILLFFPRIDIMEAALPLIQKIHPQTDSVHAGDPDRKIKIQKMRTKETQILLTTTILERGVTFPNIDVAVIGADHHVFIESALVQISGRVGRSADYPHGMITFFHFGKTEEMIKAKNQIMRMNREARRKGLILYESFPS